MSLSEAPEQEPPQRGAARPAASAAVRTARGARTAARVLATPALKAARSGAVAAILAALLSFLQENERETRRWLREELLRRRTGVAAPGTPTRGPRPVAGDDPAILADVDAVIEQEFEREQEFARKQMRRVARDTTAAVAIPDRSDRERALDGIMRRERVYTRQRSEAMAARTFAAVERAAVRRDSPNGAFWKLDPNVREHTVGCLILGGKFWPWAVLDRVHPPRHAGCPCRLVRYHEAVARGLMRPGDVLDVNAALGMAAHVVMEGSFVPQPHEVEGIRALLFEARMVEADELLVDQGVVEREVVDAFHGAVQLQLPKPVGLRERFEHVGLGRDAAGWFVYGPRRRCVSQAAPDDVTQEMVDAAAGPQEG